MKKVLIVHAHENPKSYCSALKDTLIQSAKEKGHDVRISDLYEMRFNPVASKNDFKKLSGAYYRIQNEQRIAAYNGGFVPELQNEMDNILWADMIFFTFPLWWFSMPAILKGWVDRVMAFGFSYGDQYGVYDNGRFKDKKAMCIITTGGPEHIYTEDAVHKTSPKAMMHHIQHNIIKFNGIEPLDPFIVFGAARLTDEERKGRIESLKTILDDIL